MQSSASAKRKSQKTKQKKTKFIMSVYRVETTINSNLIQMYTF